MATDALSRPAIQSSINGAQATTAANVIQGVLVLAYPSWRFRSTWMGVIVHSVENVFGGLLILGLTLGLA